LSVFAGIALVGCGALVGVQDLELVNEKNPTKPDARMPAEAGAVIIVDAGGGESDGDVPLPPPQRPQPGKYTYDITGHDGLVGSFQNTNNYKDPATIELVYDGDDCFTETFTIRPGYVETFHICRQAAAFAMDKGTRTQTLYGVTVTTSQTCSPGDVYIPQVPSPAPYKHSCTGHNDEQQSGDKNSNFTTAGDYSFVGVEQIAISGSNVDVVHFHDAREVTGSQTGTNIADWYFSAKSGVVVRLKRNIDVHYKFGVFDTNYVEALDMTLAAPPP
jgi:hypothetical protein